MSVVLDSFYSLPRRQGAKIIKCCFLIFYFESFAALRADNYEVPLCQNAQIERIGLNL